MAIARPEKNPLEKIPALQPSYATRAPSRVVIDRVTPDLERGRFAAKCALGQSFTVEAIILCDGHEMLQADLLYRMKGAAAWQRLPFTLINNDTYRASFIPTALGRYEYTVEAAIDRFAGWRDGFFKKLQAIEASPVDYHAGLELLQEYRGTPVDGAAAVLQRGNAASIAELRTPLFDKALEAIMCASRDETVKLGYNLPLVIDPAYAAYSSWYEFFPRSRWFGRDGGMAPDGNLRDAAARLRYIAELGFDVAYLPPIHPIGESFRKGRNNAPQAGPDDVGSPWAIGDKTGGHKAIHPALGTFADFANLVRVAAESNIRLALDLAFQCSPDHPYVAKHPEWFKKRSDGSIQYAENPPKKYQDIYPLDFQCAAWRALWEELKSVIEFWVEKGVRIFRVDNPHTKAFPFWEWVIGEIQADHPDVIFLAEAFARPHVMAYLAKIGFSQSYTYFAWRHTKEELTDYMTELTRGELKDYFRPNFWPNTPDILTRDLQSGSRTLYMQRLILAATLTANYGIYGPAYELMESAALSPGKEDARDSEKYQVRDWQIDQAHSLAPLIRRLNRIRRENKALHNNDSLRFHPIDNPNLLAFTKQSPDGKNTILMIINLDAQSRQSGTLDLQIQELGIAADGTYQAHDLLSDARYMWRGWRNFVSLDPFIAPAHIFRLG